MNSAPLLLSLRRYPSCSTLLAVLVGSLFVFFEASAEVVLYEGFSGYTTSAGLNTVTPNENTIGLGRTETTSSYANAAGSNSPSGMTISSSGLSLGSLSVSGGSVSFTTATSLVASADITSTLNGTDLWGSYLASFTVQNPTTGAAGLEVRLNSNSASTAANAYFRSNADTRGNASANPAISYDLSLPAAPTDPIALALNTTYIILSKFTGVGTTSGTASASLWALNASQFDAFIAAERSESFLNDSGNVSFKAAVDTNGTSGAFNWNTSTTGSNAYLEIVSAGVSGKFDEIRYGSTAADVTPVPEPSTALLLGTGAFLSVLRRRRK